MYCATRLSRAADGLSAAFAEVEARANQVANALIDRELDPTVPILLLCDHGVAPPTAITIDLPDGWIDRLIGVDYSADEVADSLIAIGCTVGSTETGWSASTKPVA